METLLRLEKTIADRRSAQSDDSYVAKLFSGGVPHIARKVGEEAVEAVVAATSQGREELRDEAADLLFHLLVLLNARDVSLSEVCAELDRREGTSGLEEKASRSE